MSTEHPVSSQPEKLCPRCGETKPRSAYHRNSFTAASICKPCKREYNYEIKYGCSPSGACEICGSSPAECVDHDHACCPRDSTKTCGKCVRGFLCMRCNSALGLMMDDPGRLHSAARYISRAIASGATNGADGGTGTVALDLDALRAVAEERARTLSAATVLDYERTFPPPAVLALIERAEKAERTLVLTVRELSKEAQRHEDTATEARAKCAGLSDLAASHGARAEKAEAEMTRLREGLEALADDPDLRLVGHSGISVRGLRARVRALLAGGEGQ